MQTTQEGKNPKTTTTTYKQPCTHVLFGKGLFFFVLYNEVTKLFFWGGIKKTTTTAKDFYIFQTAVYQYPPAAFVNCSNMCGLESKQNSVPNASCWLQLNILFKHAGPCRLSQAKYTKTANPDECKFMAVTESQVQL